MVSALAKADYSAIDKFIEGSLVRKCCAEAICVRWIGGEQLKHCSTHVDLKCVRPQYLRDRSE